MPNRTWNVLLIFQVPELKVTAPALQPGYYNAPHVGVSHTQHVRDKHSLQLQDLENLVPEHFCHAFALNGWAPAPAPPRTVDWTLDSIEGWIVGLLSEFRAFPPSCVDEKNFIGTDGSAQNPPDPDTRVAAFSVSWLSEEGEHTLVRDLGRVETTVDAAELVAVYVAASAAERANFNNVSFLTDRKAVVSGISGSSVQLSKAYLWRELRAVLKRRSCFQVAWVPAHGRSGRGAQIPPLWRRLNKLADDAAVACSMESFSRSAAWSSDLVRRRKLVNKILHFKMDIFDEYHQCLLAACSR